MLGGHRQLLNLHDSSASLSQVHWVRGYCSQQPVKAEGVCETPLAGVGGGAACPWAFAPVGDFRHREVNVALLVQPGAPGAALGDNPPSGGTRCVSGDCQQALLWDLAGQV